MEIGDRDTGYCTIGRECKMGLLSHRVKRNKVEGDHIYTWRAAFTYSHHGIYIGDGKVVHFTPEPITTINFPISSGSTVVSSSPLASHCVFRDCAWRHPKGGVVVSCLDCFTGTGSLYSYAYNVSSVVFLSKLRGGTCTTAKPDPPQEAVNRALYLLTTLSGFGPYDVLRNNCEDFALYCKTGLVLLDRVAVGGSGQVTQASSFLGAPLAGLASYPLAVLGPGPVGVAAVAAGVYYVAGRYAADMGVRSDVVKIGVKDLPLNLGWLDQGLVTDKESSKSK